MSVQLPMQWRCEDLVSEVAGRKSELLWSVSGVGLVVCWCQVVKGAMPTPPPPEPRFVVDAVPPSLSPCRGSQVADFPFRPLTGAVETLAIAPRFRVLIGRAYWISAILVMVLVLRLRQDGPHQLPVDNPDAGTCEAESTREHLSITRLKTGT